MKEIISFAQAYEIADQIAKIEIESERVNAKEKQELYLILFDVLKKNGVEEDRIVSEAHKLIEESLQDKKKDINVRFTNDSWFYQVAREARYSSAVTHSDNTSPFTHDLKGTETENRTQFIKFNEDIIEESRANIEILSREKYLDDSGNEITIEWSKLFNDLPDFTFIKNHFYSDRELWRQQRDSRQSILPLMRLPILALTSIITNKWLCAKYYALVKIITDITPKKLSQYIRDVHSLSDLLHWVKEDAWKWNFIDIPCPECSSSMKTKMREDYTWVFVCKNWDYHKQDSKEFGVRDDLLQKRISQLQTNKGNSAVVYLNKKGIEITEN